MVYRSRRDLPDLAEGMIRECIRHFCDKLSVTRSPVVGEPDATRFVLSPTES
jgi:hypothetical protein